MLEKLLQFFRRLFGSLFGRSADSDTKRPPADRDQPTISDPLPEEEDAQDASEINPDTVIVVVNEEELDLSTETTAGEADETLPEPPATDREDETEDEEPIEEPPVVLPDELDEPEDLELPKHTPRYLWCLDNGHGKKTAGKRSPKLPDGRQFFEYEFNRDVVGRIIKGLEDRGVAWFNVVPEKDIDDFLEGRVNRANGKNSDLPKLFVSVHSNAAPAPFGQWSSPSISGIETWFYHTSRRGRKLAAVFQKHLVEATGWKNRHIKSRPTRQFYVLRQTSMTAVLTENGFYNNKAQCIELLKPEVRQKIADAHIAAIMEVEEKGL